jgi:hypothetical protein
VFGVAGSVCGVAGSVYGVAGSVYGVAGSVYGVAGTARLVSNNRLARPNRQYTNTLRYFILYTAEYHML